MEDPMETAVPDALEGLVMSSANRRLPEELWAHVASYASGPTWRTRRGELLALRAATKLIRDAVARAVVDHPSCGVVHFTRRDGEFYDPSHIVALGEVFGAGCRELELGGRLCDAIGSTRAPSFSLLTRYSCIKFIGNTGGRLQKLFIGDCVPPGMLLNLGSACPVLKSVYCETRLAAPAVRQVAFDLSRHCPLLEEVSITMSTENPEDDGWENDCLAEVECYSMFFPHLRCLRFNPHYNLGYATGVGANWFYAPTRLDEIEESARLCVNAVECAFEQCRVDENLMNLLLGTPLRERLQVLDFYNGGDNGQISPQLLIRFARECPALRELYPPAQLVRSAGPDFYVSLWLARPTLKSLRLHGRSFGHLDFRYDNSCLFAIFSRFMLQTLEIEYLTTDIVAMCVSSQCSQTLETLSFARTDGIVPANALLNLVDVCPRLKVLEGNLCLQAPRSCFKTGTARDYDYSYWNGAKCFALWEGPFTEFDSALLDAKDTLAEVLKSRGGERRRGMNGRFFEDHLV